MDDLQWSKTQIQWKKIFVKKVDFYAFFFLRNLSILYNVTYHSLSHNTDTFYLFIRHSLDSALDSTTDIRGVNFQPSVDRQVYESNHNYNVITTTTTSQLCIIRHMQFIINSFFDWLDTIVNTRVLWLTFAIRRCNPIDILHVHICRVDNWHPHYKQHFRWNRSIDLGALWINNETILSQKLVNTKMEQLKGTYNVNAYNKHSRKNSTSTYRDVIVEDWLQLLLVSAECK